MKTKFLRFGKRTLSIALSVLMIVSTMLVGNIGVTEVSATDTTQLEYFLTGDGITTFEGESAKWISNYKNDYNSDQQSALSLKKHNDSSSDLYLNVNLSKNGSYFRIYRHNKNNGTTYVQYGGTSGSGNYLIASDTKTTMNRYASSSGARCFEFNSTTGKYRMHVVGGTISETHYITIKPLYSVTPQTIGISRGTVTTTTGYDYNSDSTNVYAEVGESVTYTISNVTTGYVPVATLNSQSVALTKNGDTYSYTINSLAANTGTFVVSYQEAAPVDTYGVTVTHTSGTGSTTLSDEIEAGSKTFTVTPNSGYLVDSVSITKDSDSSTVDCTRTAGTNEFTFTMPEEAVTVNITYKDHYTVWFNNSSNWENLYVYAYYDHTGEEKREPLGVWPGLTGSNTIQAATTSGYFGINIPATADQVIFHNGSGTQTADLTLVDDAVYTSSGNSGTYGSTLNLAFASAHTAEVASGSESYLTLSATENLFIGSSVTVTANNIPRGKTISSVNVYHKDNNTQTVSVTDNGDGTYTFTMPNADVVVSVTLSDLTLREVTSTKTGTGSVTGIDVDGYYAGDTVTVTSTPTNDSQIAKVTVYKTGDSNTAVTATTKKKSGKYVTTFTMPNYDTTVSVSFEDPVIYSNISAVSSDTNNGTVTQSATSVIAGNSITITATPKGSFEYKFNNWTCTNGQLNTDFTIANGGSLDDMSVQIIPKKSSLTFRANFSAISYTNVENYTIRYGNADQDNFNDWTHSQQLVTYTESGTTYSVAIIDISALSGNSNSKYYFGLANNGITLFSNLTSSHKIKVEFKYYDRSVVDNAPTTISTTATTLTYETPTFEISAVDNVTAAVAKAVTVNGKYINNVIDNYEIWTTQEDAVSHIKNEDTYREKDLTGKRQSGYVSYQTYYETTKNISAPDYASHTDAYGRLSDDYKDNTCTAQNWVTYYLKLPTSILPQKPHYPLTNVK